MCQGCWEKYGSPRIVNEKTKAAAELISGVYDHGACGGGLHIVVDDWNLDDASVDFCGDLVEGPGYPREFHAGAEQIEAERACLRALKDMTVIERASALALYDGYFGISQ